MFFSCEKQEVISNSDWVQGKIVGYIKCPDIEVKNTLLGIFIISETGDSLLAFYIPSSIYNIDTGEVGYGIDYFDGDSVQFKYRIANSDEKKHFDCPPTTMYQPTFYPIENFIQIVVEDIAITTVYPVDINIQDFSLAETGCSWQNTEGDTVYIINSAEELLLYISCNEDIPEIDFNKYSLIFTSGGTTGGIHNISRSLQKTSVNEYKLMIDIKLDMTTVAQGWLTAFLTPKLFSHSTIESDVNQHY